MNNSTNQPNFKKSFFEKIADFIDKITGANNSDNEMTDEEAKYVNEHFNDLPIWRRRSKR